MTTDSIIYGSSRIEYEIKYVQRKTLGITVHPDGSVTLKAPVDATLEDIQKKVHRRAAWILRQKRYFESFGTPTTERRYVSGESHLYLGRQYMLRINEGKANTVHYQNNILEIECQRKEEAGKVLQKWYQERAKIKSIPAIEANDTDAQVIHEAAIGRINNDQLLKLMTFGMTAEEAEDVIIEGFLK